MGPPECCCKREHRLVILSRSEGSQTLAPRSFAAAQDDNIFTFATAYRCNHSHAESSRAKGYEILPCRSE
jgi:hypothetical protein